MLVRPRWWPVALALTAGCAHGGPSPLLTLRRVVLNQSGSGYFERSGRVEGERLSLRLKSHEVDDVLATLTVLEQGPTPRQTVVAAGVPHEGRTPGGRDDAITLDLRLPDARPRSLLVAYAVPTANWQATYRVVLPEREGGPALLQIWALVHNSSDEDWRSVELTLATGAPLSFAFNLRRPSFTARPDASGRLTTPVVNGPVLSEQSREAETERRPLEARNVDGEEGRRGYRDTGEERGGATGGDTDRDGIADAHDRCPQSAETYNGTEDGDGCPDQGRVVVSESALRILENLAFDPGASEVTERHGPLLDAVAATLQHNPQLRVVEVQGSASEDERDPWPLALNRAASVRARLVSLGVSPERLRVRSLGTSRPLGPSATPEGRQRNRYVSFHVADDGREEGQQGQGGTAPEGGVSATNLSSSAPRNASTHEFLGATRFVVAERVSIDAGSAALVTLASREVPGEDVYLYRPESAAPTSARHPYRAARLVNRTGLTLLPGPVALFSQGTFAGEGLLQRLHDGETAFLPYAIDPSTTVTVTEEDTREPLRVVSVQRTVITLEDTGVHRTRYRVEPGAQAPARVFVRFAHLEGYAPRNLPPDSERGREADLVPIPLTARAVSDLALEQTRPSRRTLSLIDDVTTDLAPYLSSAPESVRNELRAILDQRAALARAEREADELREQLSDVANRNAELRETLRTLQNVTDQARLTLRTALTRQLQESMARHESLSRDLGARGATASALRTQLLEALRGLRLEVPEPATETVPSQTVPAVRSAP